MDSTDFVQHGWYVGTFVYCLIAGLLPFLSTEAFLLWLAVAAAPDDVLPLFVTACVAHMLAKSLVFAAGRGVVRLPRARDHAALEAVQRRMGAGGGSVTLVFASAVTGLPPFYWLSLAAGALRWRFVPFFLAGLAGRVVRFGAVMLLPQGLDLRALVLAVGPWNLALAALTGLLAGAHASTWGMYKDSPYEGFALKKYVRSMGLGVGLALGWELLLRLDLDQASMRLLLFGLTYAAERAVAELYKACCRDVDHSKYTIPMQHAVGGRVVESRALRVAAAGVWVAVLVLIASGVHALQLRPERLEPGIAVLLLGALGGLISAVGGALKNARTEGFDPLKFLRSPALSLLWSLAVVDLTTDYLLIASSSLGFTIATIETYKTFFAPHHPSDKWSRRELQPPHLVAWRRRFTPVFLAIWIVLVGHVAWAWTQSFRLTAGV